MRRWLFIFFALLAASALANVPRTTSFAAKSFFDDAENGAYITNHFDSPARLDYTAQSSLRLTSWRVMPARTQPGFHRPLSIICVIRGISHFLPHGSGLEVQSSLTQDSISRIVKAT